MRTTVNSCTQTAYSSIPESRGSRNISARLIASLSTAVLLLALVQPTASAQPHDFPASPGDIQVSRTLTVYGSMDIASARPLVEHYQRLHPTVAVVYHELDTLDIYTRFLDGVDRGEPTADILLSPAMDLQVKLANDGYVRQYRSAATAALPDWSRWHNEVFGFSLEPAVIVYNKKLFADTPIPAIREELRQLLESDPELYFGRIATYDIERSGLGFLFLTQDAERSREIWGLVNAMGGSSVKLFTNTAAMLDHISSGRYLLGYNLVGSYATQRAEQDSNLGIVLPQDYTLVMTRTAVLPAVSREPALAESFLEFLLSSAGQTTIATRAGLYALHPDVAGDHTATNLTRMVSRLVPIKMGPALIVYLDRVKRRRFLEEWQSALNNQ